MCLVVAALDAPAPEGIPVQRPDKTGTFPGESPSGRNKNFRLRSLVMLRTINSYIEGRPDSGLPPSLGAGFFHDARFIRLLVFSIVGHLLFYAVIVKLDVWVSRHRWARSGTGRELVKLIDLAPPPDRRLELRRAPDPIKRADLDRFQFDPEHGDDVNLVSRAPKPSVARGSGLKLPASAGRIEGRLTHSRGRSEGPGTQSQRQPPPVTPKIAAGGAPKPDAPVAQTPLVQAAPPPPAPPVKSNSPASAPGRQPVTQGSPQGDGPESYVLGLHTVRAQYMAYVRAKIRVVNEKIMPRTWIAEVLNSKVSADFEVRLDHAGRLVSTRKVCSTGYPRLDDVANDAIYMASPFDGFPPDAGDIITLTVTVYYTPWR